MRQYLLHIFFLLCTAQSTFAQQFPVQVVAQTIPPRPVLLSDYANPASTSDKVRVQLILNDLTELNREVRLRVSIQGQGINAQSRAVIIGATPIFLEGGVPTTLGAVELAPYFDFQNLEGIAPSVYGTALPEGPYSICFEVFDQFTGSQVSARTCTNFVLFNNDPPLLNLPLNASGIEEMNPLNIIFQWTPRHINVSNVQYELTLAELWDINIDPQAAFLSSPPIFQTTTSQTTFIYDNLQPSLVPGRRYGWRVRAFALDGAEEIGLFTNNGFSEIFHFDYQGQCADPLFPEVEELSNRSAKVTWQGTFDHLDYTLKYREKNAGSDWYDIVTPREYVTADDLKAETTYEFKVQGNCMFGGYGETLIQEFTTLSDEASAYQGCAIEPDPVVLDNQEVLPELFLNDVFTAGDFPVTVLQVDSATAPFSGGGYVVVPWLGDTKISVAFNGIQINTDMELLSGNVETTYDADWGNVEFIDDILEIFEGDNDLTSITIEFDIPTVPDGAFEDYIEVNDDGSITITDPETGVEITYPGGDDVIIVDMNPDGSSDVFIVDEDGNVTQGGEIAPGGPVDTQNTPGFDINGNIAQLSAAGIKVTFIDDAGYSYGFDKVPDTQYDKLNSVYDRITDASGDPYDIIHKAIKKDVTEGVKATLEVANDSLYSRLVFKTEQGLLLPHTRNGNTLTIDVKGLYGFENELVYATVLPQQEGGQQTIAGSFRLWHLTEREANITIVRVNNATLPSNYEQELNNIYGRAVINFTYAAVVDYEVAPSLYGGDNLLVGESGALSNYTSEQRDIINNFKGSNGYDVNTYYLFVFSSDIQPSRPIAGFMPLKRQYGFIFDPSGTPEENTNDRIKVMAHELGHGVFGLEHPFTQFGTDQGATDWVMDYGDGTTLVHTDWAQMHNPDFNFYLFQDDEDGESTQGGDTDPLLLFIKQRSDELAESLYSRIYTIVHCQECSEDWNEDFIEGTEVIMGPPIPENDLPNFSNNNENIELLKFGGNDSAQLVSLQKGVGRNGACIALFYSTQNNSSIINNIDASFKLSTNGSITQKLILLDQTNQSTYECTESIGVWGDILCSDVNNLNNLITDFYIESLFDSLYQCLEFEQSSTTSLPMSQSEIASALSDLKSVVRTHQGVQFEHNGVIYDLNEQGNLVEVENPLSNQEINSGDWTDNLVDFKTRMTFNEEGILQYTAFGIRSNLPIADGKTADLEALASHMRLRGNLYLLDYLVNQALLSASMQGVNLDGTTSNEFDNEFIFPDGKKVNIDEEASFWKILSESGSHLVEFAKTSEIEQKVYNNDNHIIKAPSIGTGSLEAVARSVTDITSTVAMVYDLFVDEEARKNTVDGFSQLKDQIKENPSDLFPVLWDIALEEVTGNTQANYAEIDNLGLENPRSQHIISKGTVRTSITIFTSASLLQKLPGISKRLIYKILRLNFKNRLKNLGDISDEIIESLLLKIDDLGDTAEDAIAFFDDFADATEDTLRAFGENIDLVDNWKFLDDAGVDDAIRKNIDGITDPDAALDAIQASGKAKPTWPEIQALFKRGNDYNTKARTIYGDDFVEVVLKGVDGKAGKRLDTYIPPSNGIAGEIISRKATTLSEIQPNTFKNYLNELITKYPKGAELNSSKFPSGTTLDGDYFLEIPTSNQSFFESSAEFQKVLSDFNTAKEVDVKIKYLVE